MRVARILTVALAVAALAMLLLQYPFMHGYARRYAPARSELKPLADVVWAHDPVEGPLLAQCSPPRTPGAAPRRGEGDRSHARPTALSPAAASSRTSSTQLSRRLRTA